MPSSTVKQARVMSAISHGWRPKGSAAGIPVKVAKEFHAADAGHKYGKGMGRTLHKARKYALGGSAIHDNFYRRRFQDGGDTDLPDVGEPLVSPGPQVSAGTRFGNKASDIGSRLAYNYMKTGATVLPRFIKAQVDAAKTQPGSEAAHEAYGNVGDVTGELGMSRLSPGRLSPTPTAFSFVGPYGAHMLREQARAEGRPATIHPAYGQQVAAATENIHPALRPAVRGWEADKRDALARGQLEMRQGAAFPEPGPPRNIEEALGNFQRQAEGGFGSSREAAGLGPVPGARYASDRDIFPMSGWSYGAEGMIRKEIPDIGAKLVPTGATSSHQGWRQGSGIKELPELRLEHPAGDLHQIYDIPNIVLDREGHRIRPGADAAFNRQSNRIFVRDPKHVGLALHEMQHGIQKREGFARGSNPTEASERPEAEHEVFPGAGIPSWHGPISGPQHAKAMSDYQTYSRSSGENEAFNTMDRRAKSYRYMAHPETTEQVPRGLQFQQASPPRPRSAIKIVEPNTPEEHIDAIAEGHHYTPYNRRPYASGGGFNPERAAAIGLSRQSGMMHSTVPGRTDKLNLDVPSGSYIIPADVTSAMGQGNSLAGEAVLNRMFNKGPYGMNISRAHAGSPRGQRQSSLSRMSFARKTKGLGFESGGGISFTDTKPGHSPIVVAGGEYHVMPESVAELGGGDISTGHDILDELVKQVRDKNIKTLKTLKPPKGSSEAHAHKRNGGAIKLSKDAVHYTIRGQKDEHCGICVHFKGGPDRGHCQIVSGPILARAWCNRFHKKGA